MQQQPLSANDIKLLMKRFNLIRLVLKISGIIIGIVILLMGFKLLGFPLLSSGELPEQNDVTLFLQSVGMGVFIWGTLWAVFTFFERKIKRSILTDVTGGIKICKQGSILKLTESMSNGAAKIHFLENGAENDELYVLQSTREIELLTQSVRNNIKLPDNSFSIEYVPHSGIFLKIESLRKD